MNAPARTRIATLLACLALVVGALALPGVAGAAEAAAEPVTPVASSASATPSGETTYSGVTAPDGSVVTPAPSGSAVAGSAATPRSGASGTGTLPFTGGETVWLALLGCAFIAGGVVLRRRHGR